MFRSGGTFSNQVGTITCAVDVICPPDSNRVIMYYRSARIKLGQLPTVPICSASTDVLTLMGISKTLQTHT